MPTSGGTDPGEHGTGWNALLAYCRPGFENDCVQELIARAGESGVEGYGKAREGEGFAAFVITGAGDVDALPAAAPAIFARQLLHAFAQLRDLPAADRLTPVMALLGSTGSRWCDVWVESPDSDAGRELSALTRGFANVLQRELRRRGLLDDRAPRRLHVLFLDGRNVVLAQTDPRRSSPWPGGIPRLRRLSGAPSRSAAKLDEAIHVLLDAGERERWLKPGMSAVDLGAAPGGWSWVLAKQHLRVEAIDNGPLAQNVLDSGLVRHIRADGFTWRPVKPVDWLVCDMVEQPSRVAALIGSWFADGACRRALFNLKLPMKKRYAETLRCLDLLRERAGAPLDLRCRQLYHDREEVTVAALPR